MPEPSCLCGECAVCKHRERNRRHYGYAGHPAPDRRRRYPIRLIDVPLEVRLAAVRLEAVHDADERAALFAAALDPDPDFVAWVAEPLDVGKLRQRLYLREWKREKRAETRRAA